jgi:hypothetical protein
VRSTTRRAGKSLLVDVLCIAATGRPARIVGQLARDEETDKQLLSLAMEGAGAFSYDNVRRPLGCASLDRALTAANYGGRILGVSAMASPPWRAVIFATGNNLAFAADTAPRVIVCDLDAGEAPEDRADFRHARLREHVVGSWPSLHAAILTIVRAFHLAGRPGHGRVPLGGFEGWDELARACCTWAQLGDPDSRALLREDDDTDRAALHGALEIWWHRFGADEKLCAEVVAVAERDANLRAALEELCASEDLTTHALGYALRGVRRRRVAGKMFTWGAKTREGRSWKVASEADERPEAAPGASPPPAAPPPDAAPANVNTTDTTPDAGVTDAAPPDRHPPPDPPRPTNGAYVPPAPAGATGWPTGPQLVEAEAHGYLWGGAGAGWILVGVSREARPAPGRARRRGRVRPVRGVRRRGGHDAVGVDARRAAPRCRARPRRCARAGRRGPAPAPRTPRSGEVGAVMRPIVDESALRELAREEARAVFAEELARLRTAAEYLSTAGAAELAGVAQGTIRRWIRE